MIKIKKKSKMTLSQYIFDIFNVIFMFILGIIMFYPMWHVFCASFSDSNILMGYNGILLLPKGFNVNAYTQMFNHPLIVKSFVNSVMLVLSGTLISLVMTAMCAYILSRKNVFWNKVLNVLVLITMFFSGGLIPTYLLVSKTLGFHDSYWALIIPNALSVYNMIIMKNSFLSIPESVTEAASIDGAGHWKCLWKIVLPLSKSILAVIALYYAVALWNGWFDAAIYLSTRGKFPLQLILREILIQNNTTSMNAAAIQDQAAVGETIKYATIIFATIPILCVYPYLQKYFTKGIMIGAVKG